MEALAASPDTMVSSEYVHRYFVTGTWSRMAPQEMVPDSTEPGLFRTTFVVSASGADEFQIIRDRDQKQVIHPQEPHAESSSIEMEGPDSHGDGKNWLVRGDKGEIVTVQLRVDNGQLTMSVSSESGGELVWRRN